ncbi:MULTISPECIES: helix-turn-helix domain-containing protein [unclassified Nocardioides]|uniref:helix-turn-helix domain-containing protein n=1 Tax=unclassified Nocardioides TaxID=2615069 RepID=UPI0009E8FA57|nr:MULTISPECIES: helix-turn-helix transcriptional regulator [unclassified Nocardioides]
MSDDAGPKDNRLGDYLRARRELVSPESVGLPGHGVRRVAGLRREEVAMLAGISADYYLRLEQGRDRNPSVQVLEALAGVLQLDATATDYLLRLGAPKPRRRVRRPRPETVPTATAQLLSVIGLPAFIEGRYLDVLAANPLVTALSPNVRVGENRLRSIFLDPDERTLHPDWARTAPRLVAGFRNRIGDRVDDPRVVQLVGELSLGSEEFRRAWARHDVKPIQSRSIRIDHPQVGEIELDLSKLAIEGTDGQMLVIYHAVPGTEAADKLALLSSLVGVVPDGMVLDTPYDGTETSGTTPAAGRPRPA